MLSLLLSVTPYAQCLYAECHYADCRYAECYGALLPGQKDRAYFIDLAIKLFPKTRKTDLNFYPWTFLKLFS